MDLDLWIVLEGRKNTRLLIKEIWYYEISVFKILKVDCNLDYFLPQLQDQTDQQSTDVKNSFREGYLNQHNTMCDILDIPNKHNNNHTNRLDHQTKTIPLQTYHSLMEKISELSLLSADMKEYGST